MYYMSKPNFTIRNTYHMCINLISVDTVRSHLESLTESVYNYSDIYETLASQNKLNEFDMPEIFKVSDNLDNEWLIKLYKNYFRNSTDVRCSQVYSFYSKVKNYNGATEISRCCYCNSNQVQCLDHFLPESKFNALAVNPINLVPSCDYCNKKKHNYKPLALEENSVLIHPYYNDITEINWLKMKIRIFYNFKFKKLKTCTKINLNVLNSSDLKIGLIDLKQNLYVRKIIQTFFFVNKDIFFTDPLTYQRIENTFIKTDLNTTLSFSANSYFIDDIISNLRSDIYKNLSDEILRNHYMLQSKNLLNHNNYSHNNWKVVLYNFLSLYNCGFKNLY